MLSKGEIINILGMDRLSEYKERIHHCYHLRVYADDAPSSFSGRTQRCREGHCILHNWEDKKFSEATNSLCYLMFPGE